MVWNPPGLPALWIVASCRNAFLGGAAFLLTIGSFLLRVETLLLTVVFGRFFAYNWSFSTYSGKVYVCVRGTSPDCKQRSSTVSKKLQLWVKKLPPFLPSPFLPSPSCRPLLVFADLLKTILTTPTTHISKKYAPKLCHKMRGRMA